MFMEERHQAIIDIVNTQGRISIGEIRDQFDVSLDSARRDLRILEEKKLLKRTHGGAIPLPQVGQHTPGCRWNASDLSVADNIDAIAQRAVQYIQPNDAVYITSGTVGYAMIHHLPQDMDYTVVTNSVDMAYALKTFDRVQTYMIGGRMRPNGRIVDAFAQEFIRNMRLDLCFLTGAGFTAAFGTSNGTAETVAFQRLAADSARRCIALFPAQKVGHEAFLQEVPAQQFDILITDAQAAESELNALEDMGVQVVIADDAIAE